MKFSFQPARGKCAHAVSVLSVVRNEEFLERFLPFAHNERYAKQGHVLNQELSGYFVKGICQWRKRKVGLQKMPLVSSPWYALGMNALGMNEWRLDPYIPLDKVTQCQIKCQIYVYSGHALSYTKLVHRHATQTEGN